MRRLPPLIALVLTVVLLCAGTGRAAVPLCSAAQWVGGWEASPSDAGTGTDASLKAVTLGSDQTMRMILTPHLAGSTIRLHLSNRYGTHPVTFGAVSIADRQAGAQLQAGTAQAVTFDGGMSSVTVPAGGEVISDPVNFTVAAFTDVAVSLYLTGTVPAPTEHYTARQTSYLTIPGAGNLTANPAASAFTESTTARFYVTELDVESTHRTGAVVTFGDSLTDGFQAQSGGTPQVTSTLNLNARYPDFLQRRLDSAGVSLAVDNAGISGNRLLSGGLTPQFGDSGLSRFTADALDVPGVTDVILLEGINDIGDTDNVTAQQLISGYQQVVAMAHADGVMIQLGTLTPAGDSGAREATRQAVNDWIRTQHVSDGIVDFDAAVRDPGDPADVNPAYDGGDGLHLNPAGYQAMAAAVPLSLLARATCGTPSTPTVTAKPKPAPATSASGKHKRPHRPRR